MFIPASLPKTFLAALLLSASCGLAADLPPVVERYEQMLVRSPQKGTAFDKVYQHYFEGEGLEKLAERWQSKTGDGAAYDLLLGLLAERQGKVEQAREAYRRAVEKQGDNYRFWLALGNLEASEGKMPAAIAALEKALALNPPSGELAAIYRQLAQSQQRNFDTAAALATWLKMEAQFPEDPFVLEEVAEALLEADRFDEAKKSYEKLRDLAGTDPFKRISAMIRLAQLEERRGKTKDALAIYEAAIVEASETSWIHREVRSRIEEVYRRQDDLPGLVAYYQKWLETHPKDVQAATRLSGTLIELNRKKEAVDWLKKAVEWAPDRRDVKVELANRLRETGQPAEAITILVALTDAQPEELSYWEMLGDAQWEAFEKSKDAAMKTAALESWNRLAPESTKDVTRVSRLAELLRNRRLDEEALAQYERAVKLAPEATDLRERWAALLFDLKQPEAAWAVLNQIVEGKGATAGNYHRLATLQRRHGDPEAALKSIESGLKLEPENFELLSLKWDALANAKQWEEALALVEPLLAAAPNDYFVEDLEVRQVLALAGAGKLDATQQALAARIGEPLSERDLRLLLRLSLEKKEESTVTKALELAATQYPNSVPLIRVEVRAMRERGSPEGSEKALRRLLALQPKKSTEILEQIVQTWMQVGNLNKALEVAQELIKASPANARGYLLYADLCLMSQRAEEAFAKLREAIKLSDQANEIRLRLARAYMEAGENAKALAVYEEAFEAEEDPGRRLALMKPLTEAYFTEGRLDQLISRFRERQKAEENGWRYALYLAEIYQEAQDFGAARRELAKAIAERPKDSALVRQAITLAKGESNPAELLKYQRTLLELDPSPANRKALVEALINANQIDDALPLIRQHSEEFFSDRVAWRRLLPRLKQSDKIAALGELYEADLKRQGESAENQLALAEFYMAAGKYDLAKPVLWKVFENPVVPPASPAPTPQAVGPGPHHVVMHGANPGTDLTSRLYAVSAYAAAASQLIQLNRGGFYGGYSTTNAKPTAETYRLAALIYLGRIAQAEGTADAFVGEVDQKIGNAEERLILFSALQAYPLLISEIEKHSKQEKLSNEMSQFCIGQLVQFFNSNPDIKAEPDKVFELMDVFGKKLGDQNPYRFHVQQLRLRWLMAQGKKDEAKKFASEVFAKTNFDDLNNVLMMLQFAVQTQQQDQIAKLSKRYFELLSKTPQANRRQMGFFPLYMIADLASQESGEKLVDIAMEVIRSSYPTEPPKKRLTQRRFYRGEQAIPSTRFFDENQQQIFARLAQKFKEAGQLPKALALLDKQIKELPDNQKIYPRLVRVQFLWVEDDKAKAAEEALAIAKEHPEDDLNILAAAALGGNRQYDNALDLLSRVNVRFGADYKEKELQVLRYALQANKEELARSSAARLSGMRLEYNERSELSKALEKLGMKEIAAKVAARPSIQRSPEVSAHEKRNQQVNLLQTYLREKKKEEALSLARELLASEENVNEGQWDRHRALRALSELDKLAPYISELKAKHEESPDSVAINARLVEAIKMGGFTGEEVNTRIKTPVWLKLVRKGNTVTGYTSPNGTDWKKQREVVVDLPETVEAGIAATGKSTDIPVEAVFRNLSPGIDASWKGRSIGKYSEGSKFTVEPDQSVKISATGHDIYREYDTFYFISKPLTGDGELVGLLEAPSKKPIKVGLMLRAGDGQSAVNVALVYRGNDGVGFQYRDIAAEPVPYLKKLISLEPEKAKHRRDLAEWYVQTLQNEEAMAIYEEMVEKTPAELFQSPHRVVEVYQKTGALSLLSDRMMSWKPASIASGQSGYSPSTMYETIAKAYLQEKQPEQAEKLARKGIEVAGDDSYRHHDLHEVLLQVMIDMGRREELIEELAYFFLPQETKASPMSIMMGHHPSRGQTKALWLNNVSYGSQDGLNNGRLNLLRDVSDRKALKALNTRVQARLKEHPSEPGLEIIGAYLDVKCRKPEVLAKLPALYQSQKSSGRSEGAEIAAMMELARELKRWPGKEKYAVGAYESIKEKLRNEKDFINLAMVSNLSNLALTQSQVGDHAGAATTLKELSEEISYRISHPESSGNDRRRFNADETMKVLALLLREGREAEFIALYDQLRASKVGKTMGGWQLDQEKLQYLGTCENNVAIPWLLDDGDTAAKTKVVYEIRGAHPRQKGPVNRLTMSRGRGAAVYERPRTLKFLVGKTPDDLKPLGSLKTSQSFGTWETANIPQGLSYLSIVRVETEPDGSTIELPASAIAVARGKNLVKNPNFNGFEKRSDDPNSFPITGWSGLPAGFWKQTKDGPRAGATFVQFFPSTRDEWVIVGEKVQLEPGREYFQSAWLRAMDSWGCSIRFGRRYLNAEGKEIQTTFIPAYHALNWRRHWQKLVPNEEKGSEQIPADAKFIQPVLKGRGGADFTNLFLTLLPVQPKAEAELTPSGEKRSE